MKVPSVTLTLVETLHTCISKGITYQVLKMQRMTMLLVYAVMLAAYGHANPYSRIPNSPSDIYNQHSDKNLEVNDATGRGQSYASAKSDSYSGYASAASSSVSYSANKVNVQPIEFKSQFLNAESQKSAAKSSHSGENYWWMNANSPFRPNVQPSNGCNSNQCSSGSSASIDNNKGTGNDGVHGDHSDKNNVNIQSNPFLQGNVNIGSAHSKNQFDITKNPFFNAATSSVYSSGKVNSATSNYNQIGQKSEQVHNNGYFGQSVNKGNIGGGGSSVSCSGHGKICVAKYQCINGYVSGTVQGLTQIKSDDQLCDIDSEVCCTLKSAAFSSANDQIAAGTYESASYSNNQVYRHDNNGVFSHHYPNTDASSQNNGGIFGQSNNRHHALDLNAGDQAQQNVELGENSNGYLPPIGSEPSSNVPAFSNPPRPDVEPDNIPSPSGPAPTHIQLGCAAALICVEEEYCGMDGMINPTSLTLSSEQLIGRVPLSDCKNPDNGIIGKCCRDPNYVDPWPTGNLPANYTGGFDEQGFPTFLNIQRTRPTKKPTGSPVKGGLSHIKDTSHIPVTQAPTQRFSFSPPTFPPQFVAFPSQISHGFTNLLSGKPFQTSTTLAPPSSVSADESSTSNIPVTTNKPFPNFPNFPNPFNKNKYDESSSNTNPIVIAPQVSRIQCGVKNSVPRPNGLNDVDVSFGEIPWEAMILSNREKKLLCSGAIIAPNAVITAARCVSGLSPDEVSIKAGEWKLGYELKHEEPLPFEIVQVTSIITQPGYQPHYPSHDIAILMLNHSITFDQHIGTICIRQQIEKPHELIGKKCISTGWGKHVLQSHLAGAIMHSIDIDIITQGECQQRLLNAETRIEVDDSLVCTKAHKQNNNMCQVDLGGPLACDRGDGIYEIIGVYNQDTGCLPTNQVATFAIIDDAWIESVIVNPPKIAVELYAPIASSSINVPHAHSRKDELCDCQKSNLSPQDNQYLPPV